jgi:myosin heavy subunit
VNKYKFIEYLHKPKAVTEDQQKKLLELVKDYPYFQTGRSLLAKVKSHNKDDEGKKFVSKAALYAFDRTYLRKYLESDLFFLESKELAASRKNKVQSAEASVKANKTKKEPGKNPSSAIEVAKPLKSTAPEDKKSGTNQSETQKHPPSAKPTDLPSISTPSQLDKLIEEVYQDMADLRKSKARFLEWQERNDMEEAVEKAMASSKSKIQEGEKTSRKSKKSEKTGVAKKVSTAKTTNKDEEQKKETKKKSTSSTPKSSTGKSKPTQVKTEEAKSTPKNQTEDTKTSKAGARNKSVVKKTETTTKAKENRNIPNVPLNAETPKDADSPLKAKVKTFDEIEPKEAPAKESVKNPTNTQKDSPEEIINKEKPKLTLKKVEPKKTPRKKTAAIKKSNDKEEGKKITDPKDQTSSKKTESSASKNSTNEGHTEQEQIIDRFIEKQPSISKPDKTIQKEKDDLSKSSTRFHADIASEYLAEIYIEQGKNHRAIEIYENLSLKFPEKKSYFAGLIEKLKKE